MFAGEGVSVGMGTGQTKVDSGSGSEGIRVGRDEDRGVGAGVIIEPSDLVIL